MILTLEGTVYVESTQSIVLPPLTDNLLSDFIEKGKSMKRKDWLRRVRELAQSNLAGN